MNYYKLDHSIPITFLFHILPPLSPTHALLVGLERSPTHKLTAGSLSPNSQLFSFMHSCFTAQRNRLGLMSPIEAFLCLYLSLPQPLTINCLPGDTLHLLLEDLPIERFCSGSLSFPTKE